MINRFKSALLNAVSNTSLDHSNQVNGSSSHSSGSNLGSHSQPHSSKATHQNYERRKPVKYEYMRPHFLQLSSEDEIQVTADHVVRPIIVSKDISALPWQAGYAETINSGKSKRNEDQARVHTGFIDVEVPIEPEATTLNTNISGVSEELPIENAVKTVRIPYRYFALFDGHAGPGAAVAASLVLHTIIHEKLNEIGQHLIEDGPFCEMTKSSGKTRGVLWFPQTNVTHTSLITGALELAFNEMDRQIEEDNKNFEGVNGGCTAVVCLFILGKIFIANAGDSRAILCRKNAETLALSQDFTPESERTRVRQFAAQNPSLLGNEFTSDEYLRRPVKKDVGTKIAYRAAFMTGWAYKTATYDDLKFPVVFGHGKRSRVLATIGVTRGFGDHELSAHNSNISIKPFLSSQPEVKVIHVESDEIGEDDVIVMGTDGLWDVTPNDVASGAVFSTIDTYPLTDPTRFKYRYTSAAQDLVMHARGKFNDRNWKMSDGSPATIDDISIFVIPLWPYKSEVLQRGTKITLNANEINENFNPLEFFNYEDGNEMKSNINVNGYSLAPIVKPEADEEMITEDPSDEGEIKESAKKRSRDDIEMDESINN